MFLLIAVALIFTLLGDALTTETKMTNKPESIRAKDLIEERLRGPANINEIVIARSATLTVDDPAFQSFVVALYSDIVSLGHDIIAGGMNYYQFPNEDLVSADRHTTILPFVMAGDFDAASDNIGQVHDVIGEANGESGFQVLISGEASMGEDFREVADKDLQTGELFGIPMALIILVLVFGAVAAAIIPVVLAIVSIVVALGVTALVGQAFELSFFVVNMVTMMGLAVGIDYSLFIVSRYREERGRGLEKIDAIVTAGATASRAVFFSGVTVVLALFGLLIVPSSVFQSLGAGAILVVIAAVLAALTLLPAVLSLMGDKVNALRIPLIGRSLVKQDEGGRGGFWDWVARGIMRRPVISLVLAAGLLIAATLPVLSINTGAAGISTLPDGLQSKEAFLVLDAEFSAGLVTPARIVIDGEIDSEPVQTGIQHLQTTLESDPAFDAPFQL